MKIKNFLSLLLVIVIVLTVMVSCGDKPKTNEELIEERIETFLTAYNSGDMETVLSCLDAKSRNGMQALLNVLGSFAGGLTGFNIDLSDLFSLGACTAPGDLMELEIINITVTDSKNATATTKMNLAGTETETIYFIMVYENDGWYISNMTDESESTSSTENGEISVDNILGKVDSSFLKEQNPSEGLQYTLSEDKTYYILTGLGECKDTHIVLPEYPVDYNPVPLKEIRASFYNIEYITIPASVTKLGSAGWSYSYSDLIALNYLGNLDQWCTIEFSNASANPCANAVLYVSGTPVIETLKITETTKHINDYAFYKYGKINKIEIGKNVESIGEKSFSGCENLQSLSFSNDTMITIGEAAFSSCAQLKKIEFANKIQGIGKTSFAYCTSLEEIALGNGIEKIDSNAFDGCTNLKTVKKGNCSTEISETAFTNTAFYNSGSNWENGILYVGNCLYAIKPDVINANIKDGTLTICANIFQNHKNVTNVVIPASIERVAENMFKNCVSLKTVTLPNSLKSIENNAFRDCSALIDIVIPDSVESIGLNAFSGCTALKSITFGKGLKTIENCLGNTNSLETVKYSGTLEEWKQINNYHYSYAVDGVNVKDLFVISTETGKPIDALHYNGHYYRLLQRPNGNWEDAKSHCEALGGHLATITTAEENIAIHNYMRSLSRSKAYIGLSDAEEEGTWKWVTGEPVDYTNFDNENSNEPNGAELENYAMISPVYFEGYWSDESGRGIESYHDGFFYICEWEPDNS